MFKEPYLALLAAFLLIIGGYFSLLIRRRLNASKLKRRQNVSKRAEKDAIKLIEKNGYSIIDDQSSLDCQFTVDNKKVNYKIRADFIVTKGGKKFVIEVKSGEKAPDPKTPATRRQLLEYAHAYQADGVILADMTDVVLREIEFDINRTRYSWFDKLKAAILFTIIGAIVGFVIAS